MTQPLEFPLSPLRLAVLISGGGTTLRNFIEKIDEGQLDAEIALVISSNPRAGGLRFAERAGIRALVVDPADLTPPEFSRRLFDACRSARPDLVAMAGFLKRVDIPPDFEGRVMNIHPALIPSFCGAGMYGPRVHAAALEKGVKLTGCTVHFVDQEYDHGPIILQTPVRVEEGDTAETLAARVFAAECQAYPEALRRFAEGRLRIEGSVVRTDG
jgi:phosphoribosylglycinamide formyltransferase 1